MKYYSTKKIAPSVDFKTAVCQGLPADNGLYFPERVPKLSRDFIDNLKNISFLEAAHHIATPYTHENLSSEQLTSIIERTLSFEIPLVELGTNLYTLELYHGPTLAFKDVGARFLAGCMQIFAKENNQELTILVATSGDTGSAVANAFLGLEGINVCVLYPSGKVSKLQEMQMTTLGQNITALEIEGTFDDARLLPQSFYYFHAFQQLENWENVTFSVPSGNLGNLCAGLLAREMGLPIQQFIAAHNSNDTFPEYLNTGHYVPKTSVKTISNAMDVGNPSNFVRIYELFGEKLANIQEVINGVTYNDLETKKALRRGFSQYNYVFDPHGAIGYKAVKELESENAIILETAHPAKFHDVVKNALDTNIPIPDSLRLALEKEKLSIKMENNFSSFKEFLLSK